MAFPTTSVLDQFTGTNGTDLQVYSANWQSPVAGVTALEIQSNAATGTVSGGVNWQTWATAYGPDEEVYVTLTTVTSAGQYAGVFTRVVNESSASTTDGYFLRYLDGVFTFYRVDNGAQTAIGSGISQTMSNGDSFGVESIGGTHTIYYKASGGSWTSLGTRSDSTYSAAGKFSIITGSNSVRFDDFGGGTFVPTLVVSEATHGHAADAVVLTSQTSIVVAETSHGHSSDNLTLTPVFSGVDLVVSETSHSHTVDSVTVSVDSFLVVAEAIHAHSVDGVTLSTDWLLTVAEASHGHTADAPVLSTDWLLVVSDALHSHVTDSVVLTTVLLLTVDEASHGHTSDALTLSTEWLLAIDEASHGHTADAVVLSTASTTFLTVQEALHDHSVDAVVLLVDSTLQLEDSLHGHTADAVVLTSDHALIVADALHSHTADAVVLVLPVSMTDSEKIALILKILSNKQQLDPVTGTYRLYDDDDVTLLYEVAAWEDTAGTIPYRGRGLRRLDALV